MVESKQNEDIMEIRKMVVDSVELQKKLVKDNEELQKKMMMDNEELQNKMVIEMELKMNNKMNEIMEKSTLKTVCVLVVVVASIAWLSGKVI